MTAVDNSPDPQPSPSSLAMPDPTSTADTAVPTSGWVAVRETWSDPDRWISLAVAAAPGVVFVVVSGRASLVTAIVGAAAAAIVGLGVRLARRTSPRSALVGVLVVVGCTLVAALTGQARGFFLLPALVPFAVVFTCLATVVARRPLTGLLLNRVAGGPADWYRHPTLRRVHTTATWTAIAINTVNATLQAVFYTRNDTAVLAIAHLATGPAFATLVAVTVVAARKAPTGNRCETPGNEVRPGRGRLATLALPLPGAEAAPRLGRLVGRRLRGPRRHPRGSSRGVRGKWHRPPPG